MSRRAVVTVALVALLSHPAAARERLRIVSSPIDYAFTAGVSESFAQLSRFPAPSIELTGTATAIDLFCAGLGEEHPDIIGASRAMWDSEYRKCQNNGVRNITEIQIGYEGIVLAGSREAEPLSLSVADLFLALAKEVPADGKIGPNPHTRWRDIDPALPDGEIRVIGPEPASETHVALIGLALNVGCASVAELSALDPGRRQEICNTLRSDGAYTALGRSNEDRLAEVKADPKALGVFDFSFYANNADLLMATLIDGVAPGAAALASGAYPLARPLYIYIKSQHYELVPGLLEFIDEYTSERAWGPDGYLVDEGLVTLADEERQAQRSNAIGLNPMWR
jgi:phosphate transport system substrate-binding protein